MSKLTEILNLFCYDPETDGANTFNIPKALNENWEKIDQLVLLAVAAAAAYDPEGSYAVGDYCTHGGKMHKCNTPIPSGEAWNAEHWTETTVAKELAGRLSLSGGTMTGPLRWPNSQYFGVGGQSTEMEWASGKVSIKLIPTKAVGNDISQCVNIRDTGTGAIYPIATAVSPQEHAIVPKNGATLIDGFKNSYSKDQFGRVFVFFSLHFESIPERNTEIFSLPQSFAPIGGTVVGAAVLSMTAYFPATVNANQNGAVMVDHIVTGYSGPINLHGFLVIDTGGAK